MTETEQSAATKKFQKELNAGTVSLVLLSVLRHADEPLYGYQIAKQLEGGGGEDVTMMKQGALYPVLRALEKNGLLRSRVEPSLSGPPRQAFEQWTIIWHRNERFVGAVLKGNYDV
jgi:PadR family transcriptional regulator PadR